MKRFLDLPFQPRRPATCSGTTALILAILATPAIATAQGAPLLTNPPGLVMPRGFSQVAEIPPGSRLLFLSGQVPMDSTGKIVGTGDARAQARQVFENLRIALASRGASFAHVAKLTVFLKDIRDLAAFREVRDRYIDPKSPPASSLVQVTALVNPDFLMEVELVAVVP
ncbi:MAG TPA: RidA family protein [Gemmatimonadales bacterium]|nr:RidA family protein [Gemmatimonadales bacterium]